MKKKVLVIVVISLALSLSVPALNFGNLETINVKAQTQHSRLDLQLLSPICQFVEYNPKVAGVDTPIYNITLTNRDNKTYSPEEYKVYAEVIMSAEKFQQHKEQISEPYSYLERQYERIGITLELQKPVGEKKYWEVTLIYLGIGQQIREPEKLIQYQAQRLPPLEPNMTLNFQLIVKVIAYPEFVKVCVVRIAVTIIEEIDREAVETMTDKIFTVTKCKVLYIGGTLIGAYDTFKLEYKEPRTLTLSAFIRVAPELQELSGLIDIKFISVFDYNLYYENYKLSLYNDKANITYLFLRNKIDEKIIVYKPAFLNSQQLYRYKFNLTNLNYDLINHPVFYRFYNKDIEFQIPKKVLVKDNNTRVDLWNYSITQLSQTEFTIKLEVNYTWLEDADYPVFLDPSINIIKEAYPVLQNPSFETGDFTDWYVYNYDPNYPACIIYGATPDGNYYVRSGSKYLTLQVSELNSPLVLKGEYLKYYVWGSCSLCPGAPTDYYGCAHTRIYAYDIGRNCLGGITYTDWIQQYKNWTYTTNLDGIQVWTRRIYNLKDAFGALWNNTFYLSISSEVTHVYSTCIDIPFYKDGIYIGDIIPETYYATLSYCDRQVIQGQLDFFSFWFVDSKGYPFNDATVSCLEYPIKSMSINLIGQEIGVDNKYHLGYCAVGEQKYIELGIEAPLTTGIYNITLTFAFYDEYGQYISDETHNTTIFVIAMQVKAMFDQINYRQGDLAILSFQNIMDREIWIRFTICYDGMLIYFTPENIIFDIGEEKIFKYMFLMPCTYTFDFKIYFYELGIQRELILQKQIKVQTAKETYLKEQYYPSDWWEIKGNTTIYYNLTINNTLPYDLIFYIVITHPNGTTICQKLTVWHGNYTFYYPIQIPPTDYTETNFTVKLYKLIYELPEYPNETIEYPRPDFIHEEDLLVNLTALYNITGSYLYVILADEQLVFISEKAQPILVIGISGVPKEYVIPIFALIFFAIIIGIAVWLIRRRRKFV